MSLLCSARTAPLSHSLTARARPITFLHCSVLWEAINRSDRQTSQSVMRRAWRGRAAVCSGAACAAYDECLLLVTRSEMPDKRDKRDNKSVRATFNFGSSCQWRGNERWPQKKRLRQRFRTCSYSRKLADLIVPPFRRTSLYIPCFSPASINDRNSECP